MATSPLRRLRWRLTAWYLATFSIILLLLGSGLITAIRRQFLTELDGSLQKAAQELERAAAVRERERHLSGQVVDAVDELRIPDRRLYLFAGDGTLIRPDTGAAWIREAATIAGRDGRLDLDHEEERAGDEGRALRLHAERFTLPGQPPMVAVAIADRIELEDRYADLIATFGGAALAAVVLVTAAGFFLVGQSLLPVERSMEQMRRFMADAAHELRTPLSVLRSRAEVALQQPREPTAYVAALQGIDAESQRLGRIVDDLLTLAQAEAGVRPVERTRLFLDDLVLDAADAARAMGTARGVAVDVGEFEEAPVLGDPHLLRQLAMILLDNAIKFTPPGGRVTVRVGREDGRAVLRIGDTGPGIPPEQLAHVFERFYRGDPSRTRIETAGGGAGLGLAIAKWIADAHGASLALASPAEGGTEATLRFPEGGSVA